MGDEHIGAHDAGSEPTSGPRPVPDPEVTRATAPRVTEARSSPAPVPARIGRYAVVRVLGEGGMGTVYEAQQENPKRTVALKVIRAGYLSADLLRRFGQESQVLGRLQHPGIAQVYEAGTVKDERGHEVPFFAMEFIRGVPLTEYAAKHTLATRDRLDLVARICDAVYHAHQKGVIHRDLKPGNILVDESGQPKILDFGIARATDSDIQQTTLQTDIGQLIGTVPYMSPEQVSGDPGDLDTRSDVYALGVIAYELLAGRLPYNLQTKMIHEAARIIREEEPARLSSINKTLRGDVETIVAKALEKDKVRRYQSAEALSSDIRRHLKDEPIAARPASTWYQAAKFAKRNKGLVTGLAAAFVLLIAGLAGTSYGLKQAVTARDSEAAARTDADIQRDAAIVAKESEAKERKTAESQRDKAEKIAEFMSDTLAGVAPSVARSRDTTMLREMMDAAAARIEKGELKDAPEAELRLRGTIGSAYRDIAQYEGARRMLEPALAQARSLHPGDHLQVADALTNLASLMKARGDLAGAEQLFREELEMVNRLCPSDNPIVASGLHNLGVLLLVRGDLAGADPLLRESLDMCRRLSPGDHPKVASGLNSLASLLQAQGDLIGAESIFREAMEMNRRLFAGDHPQVQNELNNLAFLLKTRGDLAGAEPLYHEALEMSQRLYLGDSPEVAMGLDGLAEILMSRGDLASAEPLRRQALDMRKRLFPGAHTSVATGLNNLAALLQTRGDLAGAEPLYREALDMWKRTFPGDHPTVATGLSNLAALLTVRGDVAEAEAFCREALEMRKRLFPGDNSNVAVSLNNLGVLLRARGDYAGTEALWRESLGMVRRLLPGDSPDLARQLNNLGAVLRDLGDLASAEAHGREALAMYRRIHQRDHEDVANCMLSLARCFAAMNRLDEALSMVEESAAMTARVLTEGHPKRTHYEAMVAEIRARAAEGTQRK